MREIKLLVDDKTRAISITTMTLDDSVSRVDAKAFELPEETDTISMDYIEDRLTVEEFLGGKRNE